MIDAASASRDIALDGAAVGRALFGTLPSPRAVLPGWQRRLPRRPDAALSASRGGLFIDVGGRVLHKCPSMTVSDHFSADVAVVGKTGRDQSAIPVLAMVFTADVTPLDKPRQCGRRRLSAAPAPRTTAGMATRTCLPRLRGVDAFETHALPGKFNCITINCSGEAGQKRGLSPRRVQLRPVHMQAKGQRPDGKKPSRKRKRHTRQGQPTRFKHTHRLNIAESVGVRMAFLWHLNSKTNRLTG